MHKNSYFLAACVSIQRPSYSVRENSPSLRVAVVLDIVASYPIDVIVDPFKASATSELCTVICIHYCFCYYILCILLHSQKFYFIHINKPCNDHKHRGLVDLHSIVSLWYMVGLTYVMKNGYQN